MELQGSCGGAAGEAGVGGYLWKKAAHGCVIVLSVHCRARARVRIGDWVRVRVRARVNKSG